MKPGLRLCAIAVAAATLVAHSGCASRPSWPDLPPPPSEEARSQIARVHVRIIDEPFDGSFEPALSNACERAGFYALQGALIGLILGGPVLAGSARAGAVAGRDGAWLAAFLFILAVGVIIALVPVGGFFGGLYGLSAGPDGEEIRKGMATLRSAASEALFVPRVGNRIAEVLAPRVECTEAESADAILEIGPPMAAFMGPWKADPPLQLVGAVPAKLIRASDGALLWSATFAFRGSEATFASWSEKGGRRLAEGLEQASGPIADRIADEAFHLYLLPQDRKLEEVRK